jgi:hypothetical protein
MRNNEERIGANMPRQDATLPPMINQQNAADPSTQISFIIPTEYVMLPSQGRFYPQHHPLHGKDSIEIKQMTAKEEDILTSKNLLKKGVALDKLIQSLVVDKNINTDTLTIEDRNAIIVAARISAYGHEYATQVTCPSCETKVKHKYDLLEKLENAQTEDTDIQVDSNGFFDVTLPTSKWTVKCRVLNGYDEREMLKLTESKKNSALGDSLLLDQLKMTVVQVQGVSDKALISKALDALPAKDSKYIRSVYEKVVKPLDLTRSFSCTSCGHETTLEVSLSADFFWFK